MQLRHFWSTREDLSRSDWTVIGDSALVLVMHSANVARADRRPDAFHILPGHPGCEPFRLDRLARPFASVSTSHEGYDRLVCAILAVAAAQCDSMMVTSDADAGHWDPCLEWASRILKRPLALPPDIRPR